MSIVTLRASAPAGYPAAPPPLHTDDFNYRWAAWQARGHAQDRIVRQRFIVVSMLIGASAIAAAIVYGLLAA